MRKILVIALSLFLLMTGCDKSVKPIQIIETNFDLQQAENIMKRTWKPVHKMTNSKLETRPNVQISSKEEFFEIYDFTYMDESEKRTIYETIVVLSQGKEVKDANGNLVFGDGDFQKYIPTIYDEGVFIETAYIRESIFSDEYSYRNKVELIIVENSNEKITGWAKGFKRTNIFMKNDEGKWILKGISGKVSYGWNRKD